MGVAWRAENCQCHLCIVAIDSACKLGWRTVKFQVAQSDQVNCLVTKMSLHKLEIIKNVTTIIKIIEKFDF